MRADVGAAFLVAGLATLVCSNARCASQDEAYEESRRLMVDEQLRGRDIVDERVLAAMATVPRHLFVPSLLRPRAYADHPLPIGEGQTISQPYIVALMTQLAELDEDDVVLEVGTGSGYQAAVLSRLVRRVFTIEILPELAAQAKARLEEIGATNVTTRVGDGYLGWEEEAPFDAILVTAAAPELPPPLVEQLASGGILVIPVGPQSEMQTLLRIEKQEDGTTVSREIIPVVFVPLVRER